MASDNMGLDGLVPTQRIDNNLTSHLLFQHNTNTFKLCTGTGIPCAKPGFINDKLFTSDCDERGDDGDGAFEEGLNSGGAHLTPSSWGKKYCDEVQSWNFKGLCFIW